MGKLLTTNEVAEMLNVDPYTLKRWHAQGIGPPMYRIAERTFRYDSDKLAKWLAERESTGHDNDTN